MTKNKITNSAFVSLKRCPRSCPERYPDSYPDSYPQKRCNFHEEVYRNVCETNFNLHSETNTEILNIVYFHRRVCTKSKNIMTSKHIEVTELYEKQALNCVRNHVRITTEIEVVTEAPTKASTRTLGPSNPFNFGAFLIHSECISPKSHFECI